MSKIISLSLLISISLSLGSVVSADGGTIFKKRCPYSCDLVKVPKSHCKDWKEKNKCLVEIMPGATGSGEYVFKKKCPLSCKSMDVKGKCKDWKEDDRCVVQM